MMILLLLLYALTYAFRASPAFQTVRMTMASYDLASSLLSAEKNSIMGLLSL